MDYSESEQVKRRQELERYTWNEAIEAAAIKLSYYCNDLRIIDEIRKLKKDATD